MDFGFIETAADYYEEYRVRETLDAYQMAKDAALNTVIKITALFGLAQTYYYLAGDGEAAREVLEELIHLTQRTKPETPIFERAEILEHFYAGACEMNSFLALSYDEYEKCMLDITKILPLTGHQAGQMEIVRHYRGNGVSWSMRMMEVALTLSGDGNRDLYGGSAAICSLMLKRRRLLRLRRTEFRTAVHAYCEAIVKMLDKYTAYCRIKNKPCNPDNYLFIVDDAEALLNDCKEDGRELEMLEDSLRMLADCRNYLRNGR